ncbi:MAG: phosphomannomutase/phosphoglucomutase [Candidatus Pacebacteria bacterium]|nr:phosphomannomutase/phosphoglucomutase [Candidatus Paceibacterota bacterium]
MQLNEKIFKAYDIRGIFGQDFKEDFAYTLGLAYAKMRKQELESGRKIKVVVARDMRLSSLSLQKELIRGLLEAGLDVLDIGLSSTPTFYFAVAKLEYDGGIIVSASHNPAIWNGFKIVRNKALPVGEGTGMEKIKDLILNHQLETSSDKGLLTKNNEILDLEVKHSLSFSKIENIKPLKVVIDAANAMGALYCQKLFEQIPANLISLNFKLDGTFPNHEADPLKEENLQQLKEKVISESADLGIATDGDGDRVFFVDEKGESINQAIIRGVLAKIFLREKPGAKIAYDVRPGKITQDLILENGGIPVLSRVGHSLIKAQAIKEDVYFAGESSGHFFLNMDIGCYEVPMIVILKLLEELSNSGLSASDYFKPYKKYYLSGEINLEVESKQAVLDKITETYQDGEINLLDGVSVKYQDFWFNVRASNTEEKIRLNLEAVSQEIMETKTKEVLELIKNV